MCMIAVSMVSVLSSISAEFDKRMFSEQNGTIIGFTIIVKEVRPYSMKKIQQFFYQHSQVASCAMLSFWSVI